MENAAAQSQASPASRRRFLRISALAAAGAGLEGVTLSSPAQAASAAPAIFYSPHQDDEAIGMAGSIMEHKAAGRPVYLVLVTRGENSGLLDYMNQGPCKAFTNPALCSAPGHRHSLGWVANKVDSLKDPVVIARTAEFMASAKELGVDKVINLKLVDSAYGSTADYNSLVSRIKTQILSLNDLYPGASHKFAAGWLDGNATHKACSDAAYLARRDVGDLRFHHIYAYQQRPVADRANGADYVLHIRSSWMSAKRNSILAYNTWDPARKLYSLGYHSVPTWLENAYADPREFIYTLPGNYTTGKPA
ncbi:PIG-L deacetylase family protein [Streptomyces yaizuensis]|uniref:PIG-L family deacetylase n=1 Tax=Streptomyces yaizuensis TaxID=2989713 RepID=A0ABQ5PAU2_9ACTN|nr:PIG-L family deacetylase [Streptomyces sp. YSPA8]GLF99605.1 PIG-L family deacetylase [Streptomyces sp. YSPA8]